LVYETKYKGVSNNDSFKVLGLEKWFENVWR
jgi:hypothetical protein